MVERLVQRQTIDSLQYLVAYFLSQIGRLEEIMAGGTPSEEDLTIGGADRDSPMAQIWASIIGRANDIPPEIASDDMRLQGALRRLILEELTRIGQEIEEAGGWDALEQNGFYDEEEEEERCR